MITWLVRKSFLDELKIIEMLYIRAGRRMDVMIAISFLNTTKEVNIGKRRRCTEPEMMYVDGAGFVVKEKYLYHLEHGVDLV